MRAKLWVSRIRILGAILVLMASAGAVAAQEIPVLTTAAGEFQPARGPNHFAWEQNTKARPRHYDVFVQPDGGSPIKVNGGRSNGAMGGIDGDLLVYQEFRKRKSDLYFFNLTTGQRSRLPKAVNSRHWEYWPSLSDPWLLFARWNMKQGWRRLFLHNLETGEKRVLDHTRAEKAFIGPGQVNGDYAVWSTCPPKGKCQVYRYHIPTGSKALIPNPGAYHRAPSVIADGTVYLARGGKRCGAAESLVRSPIEGTETVLVQLPEALSVGDTYAFTHPNG
ncbi:MAG: TolB family protein, partial [Actinomycetota bacterium]